jgi:hypothetical protein
MFGANKRSRVCLLRGADRIIKYNAGKSQLEQGYSKYEYLFTKPNIFFVSKQMGEPQK